MSLEQKDLELIERIIYKNGDDTAISIARSFERLEERVDAMESRIYARMADLEEKIAVCEHNLNAEIGSIRDVLS
jgi:hypothetical protein